MKADGQALLFASDATRADPSAGGRPGMDRLLTIPELTRQLQVSRATVYRLMQQGLPYLKVGKQTRFDLTAVQRWLDVLRRGENVMLAPGNYRCDRCGWLGSIPQPVPLQALGPCPQCGTRGHVARI